jgi:uncharacterized cysteine cluster protein YcgN (CxxCxxCC family)
MSEPFWQTKTLNEMNDAEWESLCDGCARCCVEKLEDEDTGEVVFSNEACGLLNIKSCRCRAYDNRQDYVPGCLKITPEFLSDPRHREWLPPSCAYRRLAEGQPLEDWHPLISGNAKSVETAAISMKGWLIQPNKIKIHQ